MVDIETRVMINRPRAEVASYASNPDNAPEWYKNIQSVEWRTPRPLNVGSHIAFVARFMGRTLSYVYEVVELIHDRMLIMRTVDGPVPMETTYMSEDVTPAATRMTLRNRGEPTRFAALLAPFITSAMRSANQKDLKRIKLILEENRS